MRDPGTAEITTVAHELALGRSQGAIGRLAAGAVLGLIVTLALFQLMQVLIRGEILVPLDDDPWIPFTMEDVDVEEARPAARHPKPDPPPLIMDEPQGPVVTSWEKPQTTAVPAPPGYRPGSHVAGLGPVVPDPPVVDDRDVMPRFKIAPEYPVAARNTEGYCVVEYKVTAAGTVTDARVVESQCTHKAFFLPSLKAAQKFKYWPRIVSGEAVDAPGIRNRFTYELRD